MRLLFFFNTSMQYRSILSFAARICLQIFKGVVFLSIILIITCTSIIYVENVLRGLHSGLSGDASIFMTVGRGILNDLTPYQDLFETKPPGIFLIYALSLHWFDGIGLLRLIMLIICACSPLLFIWLSLQSIPKQSSKRRLFFGLIAFCFAIIINLRIMPEWDRFQLLANFLLFLYTMLLVSVNNYWTRVIIGAVILFVISLLREPLILLYIGISILMIPSLRGCMIQVVYSSFFALCLWFVFMLTTGYLWPYFHIYLPNILITRGDGILSLLTGSLRIWNFLYELKNFSLLFSLAFILLCLSLVSKLLIEQKNNCIRVQCLLRLLLMLYITTLAIQFGEKNGGLYFENSIPAFTAIIALWLQLVGATSTHIRLVWHVRWTGFFAIIAAILVPPTIFAPPLASSKGYQWQVAEAGQLDRILDRCDEDRYFYWGTMQPIIGLARHSPLGPLFFQEKLFLDDQFLAASILPNVQLANIILVDTDHKKPTSTVSQEVETELSENFTLTPWLCAGEDFINPQGYQLFFRKRMCSAPPNAHSCTL